jgi:hypothetical protein
LSRSGKSCSGIKTACQRSFARTISLENKDGYRAWIRTMNNASKGRCVTVTPRGKKEISTLVKANSTHRK